MTLEVGKKYHTLGNSISYIVLVYEHNDYFVVDYVNREDNSYRSCSFLDKNYILTAGFVPYTPKKTLKRYGYFRNCHYANTKDRCLCLFFELESVRDANFSTDNDAVPGSKFEVSVEVDVN